METPQIDWKITEQVKEHAWYETSKDYRVTLKPTLRTSEVRELTMTGFVGGELTFALIWDGFSFAQLCYYPKNLLWPIMISPLIETYDEMRDLLVGRAKESAISILQTYQSQWNTHSTL